MRRRLLAGASLVLALAAPLAASAQVTTTIVADVDPARALGTTVARTGGLTTIDGGTLSGANLFHSFAQFSLGNGETAQWVRAGGGAAAVSNVISRVTGGQVSQIAGTLDSTGLPNASFFFVNPAGIVFGAGARVNVPAAAHFSTANELRFADGARFAVTTPGGSTLSMAAPASFGFLGTQGDVTVNGVGLEFTPAGASLALSGANVRVVDSTFTLTGLDMIGVGTGPANMLLADPLDEALESDGEALLSGGAIRLRPIGTGFRGLRLGAGSALLDAADVTTLTVGRAAGDIVVAATRLDIVETLLTTTSTGAGAGGDILAAASELNAIRSRVTSTADGNGLGGDIRLSADSLISDDSAYRSDASGAGLGGDVTLEARELDLIDTAATTSSSGIGGPGDVALLGDRVFLAGGVYGSSPGDNSDSGNLFIQGESLVDAVGTILSTSTFSAGAAGAIVISAPEVYIASTLIESNAEGSGGAGQIVIDGDTLFLNEVQVQAEARGPRTDKVGLISFTATRELGLFNTEITSNAFGDAVGGVVSIEARDVVLEFTNIASDTFGFGEGGGVFIEAERFTMKAGQISADTVGEGAAGAVTLEAARIELNTDAKLSSDAFREGDAGGVIILGGDIQLLTGASITSKAQSGTGDAGAVSLVADALYLEDASISSDTESFGDAGALFLSVESLEMFGNRRAFTFISSDTLGEGNAGGVTIDAGSIKLDSSSFISSNSFRDGNAGSVTIRGDSIEVLDGSFIASDTQGFGNAGDVTITGGALKVEGGGGDITYISSDSLGEGDAGTVTIDVKTLTVSESGFISSDTYDFAPGGDVVVRADTVSLINNGNLRSGTFSSGDAGNVTLTAKTVTLTDGGAVSSEAFAGSGGAAGSIELTADTLSVSGSSRVSTSSRGDGDAGAVFVDVRTLKLDDFGTISSAAIEDALGASGALFIDADTISITNNGGISTISNNANPAGLIDIVAGSVTVDGEGAEISSSNLSGDMGAAALGGDAGSIFLSATDLRIANGGRIATNAEAGAAGEIVIDMPATSVLTLEGARVPGSIETSSGRDTGGRITIAAPLAIVSNGGSILALGDRQGANVVIQTRFFINSFDRVNTVAVDGEFLLEAGVDDVSSGTVNRDLSVLDASQVLRGQCPVARSTGQVSQLVVRQTGPYAPERQLDIQPKPLDQPNLVIGACS